MHLMRHNGDLPGVLTEHPLLKDCRDKLKEAGLGFVLNSGAQIYVPPEDHGVILENFQKRGIDLTPRHLVVTEETLKLVREAIGTTPRGEHERLLHSLTPKPRYNSVDWAMEAVELSYAAIVKINDCAQHPKDNRRRSSSLSCMQDSRRKQQDKRGGDEVIFLEVCTSPGCQA